jgi:hypothetical protein
MPNPHPVLLALTLLTGAWPDEPAEAPKPQPGLNAPSHRGFGPPPVAWYAKPGREPGDAGGYVGGNHPWCGEPRRPDEGTFGWDYLGCLPRGNVFLWWWRGKYQGGTGAYQTDPAGHH